MSDIREDLKAYVDRELPHERAQEVAAAVQNDPALQREVGEIETLSHEIRAMAPAYQPKGMQETLSRVGATRQPTGWGVPRLAWAGLAACVVLGGFLLFRGDRPVADTSPFVRSEAGRVTFDKEAAKIDPETRRREESAGTPVESPRLSAPAGEADGVKDEERVNGSESGAASGEPSRGTGEGGAKKALPDASSDKAGSPPSEEKAKDGSIPVRESAPQSKPADSAAGSRPPAPAMTEQRDAPVRRDGLVAERIVVEVEDIDKARAAVIEFTAKLDDRESMRGVTTGKNELTIRIDPDRVGDIVESLERLGKVTQRPATAGRFDKAESAMAPGSGGAPVAGGLGGGGGGGGAGGRAMPDAVAKARVALRVALKIVFVKKPPPSQNVP